MFDEALEVRLAAPVARPGRGRAGSASGLRLAISRRERLGDLVVRVEDHRAEVLGVDRPVRRRRPPPRSTGRARGAHRPASRSSASQPSPSRPTRRSSPGARPPSHTSGGCCTGFGSTAQPVVVEARRRRGRRRPRSRGGGRAAAPRRTTAPGPRGRRRTPAARPGSTTPSPNAGQQPAAREHVEARPLLGQQRRVAAGQHLHAGAELQLLRAPGREREPDDRVGRVAAHPLRQPQRVEPLRLERVDQLAEAGRRRRSRCAPSPNPIRTFIAHPLDAERLVLAAARAGRSAACAPRRDRRRGAACGRACTSSASGQSSETPAPPNTWIARSITVGRQPRRDAP